MMRYRSRYLCSRSCTISSSAFWSSSTTNNTGLAITPCQLNSISHDQYGTRGFLHYVFGSASKNCFFKQCDAFGPERYQIAATLTRAVQDFDEPEACCHLPRQSDIKEGLLRRSDKHVHRAYRFSFQRQVRHLRISFDHMNHVKLGLECPRKLDGSLERPNGRF